MTGLVTRRRLARLGGVASAQVGVQLLGFAAGVLLVRHMEQVQYGYYTLALSMASVGVILTDLGLASAVMAIGGRLIGQRAALGHLVSDAHMMHRWLSLLSCVVLVPCFGAMLLNQQATPAQSALLVALTLVNTALNVRSGVAQTVLRLLGKIGFLQRLDLAVNAAKLGVLMLATTVALDAGVALIVNLGVAAVTWWMLGRQMAGQVERTHVAAGRHAHALTRQIRQQAPNAIYFVLSSQVTVWLIGIFGNAQRVAEVGALGRLAALFSVLGAVTGALVLPYFARRHSLQELNSGFVGINAFYAALLALLVALTMAYPSAALWVLGGNYAGLHSELVWMMAAATLAAWGGTLYSVACARGWVVPFGWVVGTGVLSTALAAGMVDVGSVRGGFVINTTTAATGTAVSFLYFVWQMRRHARLKAALA